MLKGLETFGWFSR